MSRRSDTKCGNTDWSTLANWNGVETPGSADEARFGDTSSFVNQSKVDTSRTIAQFVVNGPSSISNGDYTFSGANTTLTVSTEFRMFQPNPVKDNATIFSGLTVDAANFLIKNDSHLTISGGGSLIALIHRWARDITGSFIAARLTPLIVLCSGGFGWPSRGSDGHRNSTVPAAHWLILQRIRMVVEQGPHHGIAGARILLGGRV